jgi:FtsP/CotA-like multicopper oxidase with cupredoxin domain
MTSKRLGKTAAVLALGLAALALTAPSFAAELAAVPAEWTPPVGDPIAMWAYVDAGADASTFVCPGSPVAWTPGPTLTAVAGNPLTINIKNCLSEPVSILIPGQIKATAPVTFNDTLGRTRVRSLDAEVAPNAVLGFTWGSVKAGTYLYYTAAHPAVGVQMGLYGALTVDSSLGAGCAYSTDGLTCDVPYAQDQVVLLSEIDPALHAAVATGNYGPGEAVSSTLDYRPTYYLINGQAAPPTQSFGVTVSQATLLRILNAGLKSHSPTLGGGLYMTLVAEDGNLYPFSVQQYGAELPPQKTIDAILNVGSAGSYALYDRALGLMNAGATGGGMYASIDATALTGAPVAYHDPGIPGQYTIDEDTSLATVAGGAPAGVLDNDTPAGSLTASLVSDVFGGTLSLAADGSFTYTPNPDFNGVDQFTYVANDGALDSNVATATIAVNPVNDPPIAVADAYDAVEGEILSVAAPGVLGNDSDVDGDALTVSSWTAASAGSVTGAADGSFDFDATLLSAGAIATFDYVANDGSVDSTPATVTINVIAFVNTPPVAVDDFVNTPKNTVTPINVIANDYDPDPSGSIDPNSVELSCGLPTCTTSAGGTVTVSGGGIVTFTPKNAGYRGTDTFTYIVYDDLGAPSNSATVQINVTR